MIPCIGFNRESRALNFDSLSFNHNHTALNRFDIELVTYAGGREFRALASSIGVVSGVKRVVLDREIPDWVDPHAMWEANARGRQDRGTEEVQVRIRRGSWASRDYEFAISGRLPNFTPRGMRIIGGQAYDITMGTNQSSLGSFDGTQNGLVGLTNVRAILLPYKPSRTVITRFWSLHSTDRSVGLDARFPYRDFVAIRDNVSLENLTLHTNNGAVRCLINTTGVNEVSNEARVTLLTTDIRLHGINGEIALEFDSPPTRSRDTGSTIFTQDMADSVVNAREDFAVAQVVQRTPPPRTPPPTRLAADTPVGRETQSLKRGKLVVHSSYMQSINDFEWVVKGLIVTGITHLPNNMVEISALSNQFKDDDSTWDLKLGSWGQNRFVLRKPKEELSELRLMEL